jgi:uncharacterized phage protein (TIGR01671 family)
MREIKFRAWDLKSKSFYKPTYEAYNGKLHDISITLNGFVMERTLEVNASMLNSDNYILMQFTGLTDKNGVEIYEGDILGDFGKTHPCKEYVSNVVFNQKKGQWYLEKSWIGGQRFLAKWNKKMKVIGNIYENQELL